MRRFIVALAVLSLAIPALAQDRLPFANFGDYETALLVTNTLDLDCAIENPIAAGTGVGAGAVIIPAHQTRRYSAWPRPGGGSAVLTVPDGIVLSVEVRDPLDQALRLPPITPISPGETARFHALASDGFVSYLFVHAPEGGAVTLAYYDATGSPIGTDALVLEPGETQIPRLRTGTDRVDLTIGAFGWPENPVTAFAFLSHQPDGEMLPVVAVVDQSE